MIRASWPIACAVVLTTMMVSLNIWSQYCNQGTTHGIFSFLRFLNRNNMHEMVTSAAPHSSNDFIYLIQTESCLSSYLMHKGLLGGATSQKVLVLSWKTPCKEANALRYKHIEYLYKAGTTWSEGRNLLYRFSKSFPGDHLYYIFLDDDMEFYFRNDSYRHRYHDRGIQSPLQAFEDFLRSYEPAVGMPMHCSRCLRPTGIAGEFESLCCDKMNRMEPLPDYLPVAIHFDAAFNAFHKNAVEFLLPYRLDYDNQSWWESQKFVILLTDILFRGQVLRFSPVTAINIQHRTYPKLALDNWRAIYDILRSETPTEYRNRMLFVPNSSNVDVFPVVKDSVMYTPTWNITIPRTKTPVIPYKHFK